MIFEPALLPDFGRASRRHLRASLTCYAHLFIVDTLHMDPWRRIVGVDTTSKDYQQGEIFESAVLDEGQELGILLGLPSV